jgi:hypothetical protein
MALLKSVENNPDLNFIEYRDQYYYGKHQYRARISVPGIRRLYYANTFDEFKVRLDPKKKMSTWSRIPAKEAAEITPHLDTLEKLFDWSKKQQKAKAVTVRSESNTMAIFCSDLALLHELRAIEPTTDFTEASISQYVGVKTFVNEPKHKFRIYLRGKVVEKSFREDFSKFLKTQTKLYPCSSLNYWLNDTDNRFTWSHRYTSSGHFIDYDDESTLSYLMLMFGEFFGKRYKLEKRPTTV